MIYYKKVNAEVTVFCY